MKYLLLLLFLPCCSRAQKVIKREVIKMQNQAKRVTIIRDDWGVPHIYGKSDADVTFGLMYAQCEDSYWQLEETTIRLLGRSAEISGEKDLQHDVAVRLFECVKKGKEIYENAGPLLKSLCDAAAAGINFYIYKNPLLEKRLLKEYEPWFFLIPEPLRPTSQGISQNEVMKSFNASFGNGQPEGTGQFLQLHESGSNTIALAPKKTKTGLSMLLINPHVAFFGDGQRYEAHLVSAEGLNVSGFAIFGTFYIWSGFSQHLGWAHTNTASDYEDVYLENFNHPSDPGLYRYGAGYRRVVNWNDTLLYNTESGLKRKVFSFQKTHHGPVTAKRDSFLITIRNASDHPGEYILQAWAMCRAKNFREFELAMAKTRLATNTMYADRFGNIGYWHGNVIPKRNVEFEWRLPVDGSNPLTEWKGNHKLNEIVHVNNPASGWIQNCNSTPFMSAGSGSPVKSKYPAYMAYEAQNFRGEESVRLLSKPGKISYEDFHKLVNSNHIPMMSNWLPQIIRAYDTAVIKQPKLEAKLKQAVDTLRGWDYNYSETSKATSLAVFWYFEFVKWVRQEVKPPIMGAYMGNIGGKKVPMPDSISLRLLSNAADSLIKRFGTALIPWGEINRLQRIHSGGTIEKFDDKKMSLPVAAVPGIMGSLFAFNSRTDSGQKKMYGVLGNSYVAIVELGKRIRARSIVTFGQSADRLSPHYFDQAPLYVKGKFKKVYFYKEDVEKHAERKYHPGE